MYRTPAIKNAANESEEVAGPTPMGDTGARSSKLDIVEIIDEDTTEPQELKTPPMAKRTEKEETPKRQAPFPRLKLSQKANTYTIAKKIATVETPSPIKSPKSAREYYPSKMAEARAVYKKGIENLDKFKNLKMSVKVEIRKALDRLYDLINDGPVVRNLGKQMDEDTPPTAMEKNEANEAREASNLEKRLEEHATLLKRNMKAMEELKISIDKADDLQGTLNEHAETLRATYANVAAAKPTTEKSQERATLHSVIVSSRDDQNTGEEVLEEVRKAINAKEGWIKIERVRKARDRKVVVGCATAEERKRFKDRLERAGQHLIVEEVKNKDPMLVIKGVLTKHTDEEIIDALKNQNREVFYGLENEEGRIHLKFRKKARNPHTCHAVIAVSPSIWKRMLNIGRVRIDLQRLYVEDQSPLVQCSRCLGYGHGRRFCKESEDLCSHCGGPHLSDKCPDRAIGEAPECLNCKKAKVDSRKHNAFSSECPVRRKWDSIARASVSYC